ncbi:MAG: hypothetical protein GX321_06705 [Clostridiales bacterium]|nr:hypothetical protein [Clostridiales bacterium]
MFKWDKFIRTKKPQNIEKTSTNLYSENKELSHDTEPKNEEEYEVLEIEIVPEKIVCPDCGGITLEGLEFCDKCGGEL